MTYAFSLSFLGSLFVCIFFLSVLIVDPGPIDAFPPIEYLTPIDCLASPADCVDCRDLNVDIVALIVRRWFLSEAKIIGENVYEVRNINYQKYLRVRGCKTDFLIL